MSLKGILDEVLTRAPKQLDQVDLARVQSILMMEWEGKTADLTNSEFARYIMAFRKKYGLQHPCVIGVDEHRKWLVLTRGIVVIVINDQDETSIHFITDLLQHASLPQSFLLTP